MFLLRSDSGMLESTQSRLINCSIQEAFDYLDDPKNHERFTPSIVHSQLVDRLDDGRKVVEYRYSLFGIKFEGSLEEVKRNEPYRIMFDMLGDMTGEIVIELSEVEGGTEVRYTGRYDLYANGRKDILTKSIGRLLQPLAQRYNDRELRRMMGNIQDDLEASR